ncbi:YjbE family putative metal transport protein [Gluconacetobacter azotocaptans]|uniref:YjbE family putative metal transport protein n=1 Tax=Gluconacetobacter azotocaptans TaxID=142834 RepID=A0A7W4JUA4_9PROT|nr:YjbE family putative metal transport protein [Gluconacetobacter azotocaptans]MBB2190940.1 YjbE family putative metal transport protein [Gluconacetobacter azotocaptans]MBM9401703.1 YjbE family putative metal transport protein [Gluconacetobacter azotocaptans]GBQ31808.1 integral membrane protein TerC [Gluconacetobacter azotocaptans DSM 13594]
MSDIFSLSALASLLQVILIDLTLAGDNAVVIGMAVRGLPADHRRKAILSGVLAAALIRVGLAIVAVRLLAIIGLTLAGGLLLLWVCWRMYRELHGPHDGDAGGASRPPTSLRTAIIRIVIADLSMSLDNVLAVAGAAGEHVWVLIIGLAVSVLMMAVAAALIARLLERYRWIAWVGLLIVLGVAIELIVKGGGEIWHSVA